MCLLCVCYIKMSNGRKTDPCGTPVSLGLIDELDPFSVTNCSWLSK